MKRARDRLEALRADHAEAFDGPGLAFIESLLLKAEAIGGPGGGRLESRAEERLTQLERAMADERRAIQGALEELGEAAPATALRAVDQGDLRRARRALQRARHEHARSGEQVGVPWAVRMGGDASSRGETLLARELSALCGAGTVDRRCHAQAVELGGALSSALFRSSAEAVRAVVAVARSADSLPESAGPYNAQVLAVRALAMMKALSPAYIGVLIAAIDDLAALDLLVSPLSSSAKARTPRRRGVER